MEDTGAGVVLTTPAGRVRAGHAILAGNGYLPGLNRAYAARVMPINSFHRRDRAAGRPRGTRC